MGHTGGEKKKEYLPRKYEYLLISSAHFRYIFKRWNNVCWQCPQWKELVSSLVLSKLFGQAAQYFYPTQYFYTSSNFVLVPVYFFVVLKYELRTLNLLDKCSTPRVRTQSFFKFTFLKLFFCTGCHCFALGRSSHHAGELQAGTTMLGLFVEMGLS
jgi:hypothetical protein